ncbi:MAG: DUF5916 domain-containing protein [Saprospiraceae bacterium]
MVGKLEIKEKVRKNFNNIFFAVTMLCALQSSAQIDKANDTLELAKIERITFDGIVDEDIWETIEPLPMVQYAPNAGAAPTEKTEIRFAYDDKYFYGSIRAYDSEPNAIRGNSLYRDRLGGSDHFEILLDTYNDNESAVLFNTISTGVRTDAAISNDATGGTISSSSWINKSFNTFWDTKVSRDDKGWYAETRIPFSSLRFQNVDGNVVMGLSVQRKIARKLERLIYPNIPPEYNWAFLKPSLAKKILIKNIQPTRTVYVTPYVVTGRQRNNLLNSNGLSYEWKNNPQFDIGGDVKFSITNNITADFTVNTDFAQAEADDQLINLSRFSLFFPEKRQFFQERSNVFEFKTGDLSRLFFSRRIGLNSSGAAVPILGGARLVGRFNNMDIGVLNMQTANFEDIGTENFGVVRIKRRAFNSQSTVGGILTTRIGNNGKRNIAYGVDGLIKVSKNNFLSINWSQTFDDPEFDTDHFENTNNGRFTIELNKRLRKGLGYNIGAIYSGKNYNPRLGFVERNNFKLGTAGLSYTWLFPEGHSLINQSFDLNTSTYINNETNKVISSVIRPQWSFSNRTQDVTTISFSWNYENLTRSFYLSESATVPIGSYRFSRFKASYKMAGEKILRTAISLESGGFYDGWLHTLQMSPSWFVSKHLELGLQYSYNNATFKDREESFNVHIVRLRIGTAVNAKLSTNAFMQYSSSADVFSANVRFRYNFKEGNDLWIVLNEGINTDKLKTVPSLPTFSQESILIKYLHTFLF